VLGSVAGDPEPYVFPAFSGDGLLIATGGGEGGRSVVVSDTEVGGQAAFLAGSDSNPFDLLVSPDRSLGVVRWGNGEVGIWDVTAERFVERFRSHGAVTRKAVFSPGGELLATRGRGDGVVRLWQVGSWRLVGELEVAEAASWELGFDVDGRVLAASVGDEVWLWDVESCRRVGVLGDGLGSGGFAFGPGVVASWGSGGTVVVRRLQGLDEVAVLEGISDLAFSPSGGLFAVCDPVEGVRLWDVSSWSEVGVLGSDGQRIVSGLVFAPDGSRLVASSAGSGNGRLFVWDVGSCGLVGVLERDNKRPVFSPDGSRLATLGWRLGFKSDGTVHIWDSESLELLLHADSADASWGIEFLSDADHLLSLGQGIATWTLKEG